MKETLKVDMKSTAEKMKQLDSMSQIVIASKIDALYERQLIDNTGQTVKPPPRKTG